MLIAGVAVALWMAWRAPERTGRLVLMGAGGVPIVVGPELAALWGYKPSPEAMRQRMAEALNRSFADFRATLSPEQQKRWDEELRALATARRGVVWVLDQGQPRAVAVRLGASDGTVTEVSGELAEGDAVITGQERPAACARRPPTPARR